MVVGMKAGPWRVATAGAPEGVALPERMRIERDGALAALVRLELVETGKKKPKKRKKT